MCGHMFMYHDRYRQQRSRPMWHCGTCGRVASVPLDCCSRPEFVQPRPALLQPLLGWISECGQWLLARLRPHGLHQPGGGNSQRHSQSAEVVAASMQGPMAERDESHEVEEVMVAAGER
jgi:hypothetical protein